MVPRQLKPTWLRLTLMMSSLAFGNQKGREPGLPKEDYQVPYAFLSKHLHMVGVKLCSNYWDSHGCKNAFYLFNYLFNNLHDLLVYTQSSWRSTTSFLSSVFCVILLQKLTLHITLLTLTPLLSNFDPSQISRCSCVSGKSFAQYLQVRLSGVFFVFLVHFNHCNTPWSVSEIHSTIGQKKTLEISRFIRVEVYSIFWFATFLHSF